MLELERPDAGFAAHVARQTVVVPDLRVLFLPVPKAACTSVLWQLAALAGISEDAFADSTMPEPTASLTVHDLNAWDHANRLGRYEPEDRERVLTEPGWLRFATVRDPWRRLWSAWTSKLLLREPRFLEQFGDRPWFPRLPRQPEDLVEDFRRFVAAVAAEGTHDVHWAVQHELVRQLPLDHVGRVERMGETMELLRAHVGEDRWRPGAPRDNATMLPLAPHAYDAEATAAVRRAYAEDLSAFGYHPDPPEPRETPGAWSARVEPLLGLLRSLVDRHMRVGQLHRLSQRRAARAQELEGKLDALRARRRPPQDPGTMTNLENEHDFDVHWGWAQGDTPAGFTAVVRVKNEARSLPWSLPPLLRSAARVALVDNNSTDGTASVARRVAEAEGAGDRLEIRPYPFDVARCGPEHLGTPAESVHSLAYFYNWSFSHVRTSYVLKWDGDMVLTDAAVARLRDLAWQLERRETVVRVPRLPLYVADDRTAFVDTKLRNNEPWAWPNRSGYRFVKALEWELPMFPAGVASTQLPDNGCVELKWLDSDEFAHWSTTDFTASPRTSRKRREREVFEALTAGRRPPEGVERIDAPPGTHVIEHVRTTWLPARSMSGARGVRPARG